MTVGVISAQKKMLKLLTAWEENMPMMEKAIEKFLFSVPELSADRTRHTHIAIILKLLTNKSTAHLHQGEEIYNLLSVLER